jgi:protein-S-isoprenylcysteine O-methyltransferase Ste14
MNSGLFFVLTVLCVFAHLVRSLYEILKHKKIVKPGKISFVIIFINMGFLWTSWFYVCSLDVHKINFPDIIKYLGISIVGMGIVVFLLGLFTIKTLESYQGDLITKGIYSKIRHPMYLGFILWLIGLPVFYGGLFSFILSVLFIGNILFWRTMEEKELEKRFMFYKAYRKKTIF